MYAAAQEGHKGSIMLLHSFGADVNQANNDGTTPLHTAAFKGHELAIKLFYSLRADVNRATNDGFTPVCIAAKEGNEDAIMLLHSFGADVNQANNYGSTPILEAAANHHDSVVTLLRGLGVSIPTEDLNLVTVDDVVKFFKTLNVNPHTIEKNLRSGNVDAAQLFAVSNIKDMNDLLGVHESWGHYYYNLVKKHKAIQDDRTHSDRHKFKST